MSFKFLNTKVKKGYKAFCEGTSMHGFLELYRSKICFWKLIWLCIIIIALGFTGYHLYSSIQQYINQTTVTSIQPATEQDIIYPPLKYCISHWMYWLDIRNVKGFLSQESWLVAMSRLTKIYYNRDFDVSEAEANLTIYFEERQKATSLNENYTFETFFIQNTRYFRTEPEDIFPDKEMLVANEIVYMCFTMNETQIRSLINPSKQLGFKIVHYSLQPHNLFPNLSKDDVYSLFDDWCGQTDECPSNDDNARAMVENGNVSLKNLMDYFTVQRPPDILIVDGYNNRNFTLSKEVRGFWVDLRSSVQKWLPGDEEKCKPNVKSFTLKESCAEKCVASIHMNNYYNSENQTLSVECINLATLILVGRKMSKIGHVCRNHIIFNSRNDPDQYVDEPDDYDKNTFQQCVTKCSEGCDKWRWEMSVSITKFASSIATTTVTIQYPSVEGVLVLQELDSKTWEDFVGNVGGLLGIWTGASILSLFQLVYLFCCSPDDDAIPVNTVNVQEYSKPKAAASR